MINFFSISALRNSLATALDAKRDVEHNLAQLMLIAVELGGASMDPRAEGPRNPSSTGFHH